MLCYSDGAMWMAPQLVACWGYSVVASGPAKSTHGEMKTNLVYGISDRSIMKDPPYIAHHSIFWFLFAELSEALY